jgi:hypothetical protein
MLADAEKGLEARNYKALRGFERGREVSNTIVPLLSPLLPLISLPPRRYRAKWDKQQVNNKKSY